MLANEYSIYEWMDEIIKKYDNLKTIENPILYDEKIEEINSYILYLIKNFNFCDIDEVMVDIRYNNLADSSLINLLDYIDEVIRNEVNKS